MFNISTSQSFSADGNQRGAIEYINPGRRKVNCECREVPLSLGAVQHI